MRPNPICLHFIIPFEILNTIAFLVTKKGGELLTINDEKLQFLEYVNVKAGCNTDSQISGVLTDVQL